LEKYLHIEISAKVYSNGRRLKRVWVLVYLSERPTHGGVRASRQANIAVISLLAPCQRNIARQKFPSNKTARAVGVM
jgi:hypothetical protein